MKKVLSVFIAVFLLFSLTTSLFAEDNYVERIPLGNGNTLVVVWSSDRSHVVHEYLEVD